MFGLCEGIWPQHMDLYGFIWIYMDLYGFVMICICYSTSIWGFWNSHWTGMAVVYCLRMQNYENMFAVLLSLLVWFSKLPGVSWRSIATSWQPHHFQHGEERYHSRLPSHAKYFRPGNLSSLTIFVYLVMYSIQIYNDIYILWYHYLQAQAAVECAENI